MTTASASASPDIPSAPVSVLDTPVPHINIKEDEIFMAVDGSRSMLDPVTPHSRLSKWAFTTQAIGIFAPQFTLLDSQAADEGSNAHSGVHNKESGGIMTVVYTGPNYVDFDDVNGENYQEKFGAFSPDGSTYPMQAIERGLQLYRDEFQGKASQPHWDVLNITDGMISTQEELDRFTSWLAAVNRAATVCVAVIGSDSQSAAAVDQWTQIAQRHNNVLVRSFNGVSDPNVLANWLIGQFK